MRIAVGSDHRGVDLRRKILSLLVRLGQETIDVGTDETGPVDYPDVAAAVATRVSRGEVDRGILICGSGLGMCIAANKFPGVRAAPCHDDLTAEMSRRHSGSTPNLKAAGTPGGSERSPSWNTATAKPNLASSVASVCPCSTPSVQQSPLLSERRGTLPLFRHPLE